MKKLFLTITALSTLAMTIVSCQKDEKALKLQFNASVTADEQSAKTEYSTTGVFSWNNDDLVKIYDNDGHSGSYSAVVTVNPNTARLDAVTTQVTEESAPYTAIFPEGIALSKTGIMLPAVQHSRNGQLMNMPMYSTTETEQFQFENLCGALRIRLHQDGVNVKRITLTCDKPINGKFNVTMTDGVPSIELDPIIIRDYATNGSPTTSLVLDEPQNIGGEDMYFFIYLPAGHYNTMMLTVMNEQGQMCTKTANNITITRSKYTKVAIDGGMNFDDQQGALPGLFSVRPDRKVRFSQGNLQYNVTNSTWQFAEHQTDFIGTHNDDDNPTVLDIFGWGTSGYGGTSPTYRSWAARSSYYFSQVKNITGTNYDWGLYNPITNGGNVAGQWFTLSSAEWSYLINCRQDAQSKNSIGKVDGICGLILLPDEFTYPAGCPEMPPAYYDNYQANPGTEIYGSSTSDNPQFYYERIEYTAAQWQQMEANGAVFLPAAGQRSMSENNQAYKGNHASNHKPWGAYWSSTKWVNLELCHHSTQSYQSVPSLLFISGSQNLSRYTHSPAHAGTTDPANIRSYFFGSSVRLVQDENMVNKMREYYFPYSDDYGGWGDHGLGH